MLRALAHRVKELRANDLGVAAVETALIAPVALILMSVGFAGGQALEIYHKTVVTAHTVTDLVSRTAYAPDPNTNLAELIPQSTLDTDLAMSQMTMYPYDTTNLKVVISELQVNSATNQGVVVWSEAYNGGTKLATGTKIALDPAYVASGATYLLYGQATYSYQPLGIVLKLTPITLTATEMLTIRNAQQITVNWGS